MAKSAIKEIAKLSMENLETLWAHPDKSGILMKRGGDIQTWKRRYFVVKDTFLFYFKNRQDLSAPAGVVPIQNCHVEAADSRNAPTDWVFRVTLTENEKLGEVKRKEYFLAATDSDDLAKWIDAVRCTSDSKGYLRQQVDQAREEVRNLEQRWLAASAADAGMPIASMSPAQAGQDDAVVVAALTEELRSAQLSLEAAQRKLAAANARSEQHLRQIQQVEAMTAEMEQRIMSLADQMVAMPHIQTDLASCDECMDWMVPARTFLKSLQAQAEALSGGESTGGEGVPLPSEAEAILRATISKLSTLEYQAAGTASLPDEARIAMLLQTIGLYENMLLSAVM